MEALLQKLLPGMLGDQHSFRLHDLGGKQALLKKAEARLKGYATWMPVNYRIIFVLDEDRQDCKQLKGQVCKAIDAAGLSQKSLVAAGESYQCAVRIAIEELEAWLFGDCDALRTAFPKVPVSLEKKTLFRDPDAIAGGTWEQLERILQRAGYYPGGLPKVEVAATVAPHMDIWKNRSKSFQVFRDLILSF